MLLIDQNKNIKVYVKVCFFIIVANTKSSINNLKVLYLDNKLETSDKAN